MNKRLYGPNPPVTLTFQDISFTVSEGCKGPWLTSADLARALGYARADTVERLYRQSEDGFTADQSQVMFSADSQCGTIRIFSLSGCYLMALIAHTKRARAFRKWLVDLVEQMADDDFTVEKDADMLTAMRLLEARKYAAALAKGPFL